MKRMALKAAGGDEPPGDWLHPIARAPSAVH